MIGINRDDNLLELLLVIFFTRQPQHVSCFRDPLFLYQPAGTPRNSEKEEQEQYGGNCGDAQLPAPFGGTKVHRSHDIVRQIGEQNSKDDVELKQSYQAASP